MRGAGIDRPDAGVVVGTAGAEVADVGGEEHAGYVGGVGLEGGYGDEGCDIAVLEHTPDVDVALVGMVSWLCAEQSPRVLSEKVGMAV